MSTTVDGLLREFYPEPEFPAYLEPTTTRKPWTAEFEVFNYADNSVKIHHPTAESINRCLGSVLDLGSDPDHPRRQPSGVDYVGLQAPVHPLNVAEYQKIETEGDVQQDFNQHIEPAFKFAFCGRPSMPLMWSKSQCRRTGPTARTEFVDYQLTWPGRGDPMLERAAMIGEFKKPSTIQDLEWRGIDRRSAVTESLQKEMRGYAYHYDCPQAFIYDSIYLVILQFKARDRKGIKDPRCSIDCWVIPRQLLIRSQCTVQYGLYQLAWRGWMRLSATLADGGGGKRGKFPVSIDGYPRIYEEWSGRPIWVWGDRGDFSHPNGWERVFVQQGDNKGSWGWAKRGTSRMIPDTGNCLQ